MLLSYNAQAYWLVARVRLSSYICCLLIIRSFDHSLLLHSSFSLALIIYDDAKSLDVDAHMLHGEKAQFLPACLPTVTIGRTLPPRNIKQAQHNKKLMQHHNTLYTLVDKHQHQNILCQNKTNNQSNLKLKIEISKSNYPS